KARDANIVETGRGVRAAVESLKARLPQDVEVRLVYSQADQVEASVAQVKATIVEGALLTVLIVFLFLHSWRSTIITGLTLPIAVIATFIALYAFGFTLNMMTLMAPSPCWCRCSSALRSIRCCPRSGAIRPDRASHACRGWVGSWTAWSASSIGSTGCTVACWSGRSRTPSTGSTFQHSGCGRRCARV